MLQSPPPPQTSTPTPTPAPRRSTRTRKPSTRLVGAVATASLPAPLRLRHINAEPPEQWPPRAEDLPASLHHLLPNSARDVKTTKTKQSSKQASKKVMAASRTPSSGSSNLGNSPPKPSSLDPPIVANWSHRTVEASAPYYYPASAVRDSLAREDEIRAAWVRNEPVREAQQRQWEMQDRIQKRKLGFMLEHFRVKEREEEEGEGGRADSGHEEEEEEKEEEEEEEEEEGGREAKKARRE